MDPSPLSIYAYIILIVLFLLGGGYFAASETSFATINEIRLIKYSDDGNKRAKVALDIKSNFDFALTTILIGNNIMHISLSSTATLLASELFGDEAITLCTFITTFVVFMFAEMLPKAYAKDCSEKVCLAIAPSLSILITLLTPLSIVFSSLSKLISKLFNSKEEENVTVSEEELFDIIENIDEEDKILEDEAELVKSALGMTIKQAKDIYVPLDKVAYIDIDGDIEAIDDLIINGEYTRLPVVKNGEAIGVLQIRKYLKNKLNGKKKLLTKSILDKAVFVKEDKPIDELLDYLSEHKTHFAFVKNRNGELLGTLTIEDILEELVGEIYDEEEKEKIK